MIKVLVHFCSVIVLLAHYAEAGKMVKRLKRILNNVEKKQDDPVIACTKVRLLCAASCFPLFFCNIVYST